MTTQQNEEFTVRIATNIFKVMAKGVSSEAAKKSVFEKLNAEYPIALAAWLKYNES